MQLCGNCAQLGVVVTLFAYAFVDENAMTQQIRDKLGAAGVAVSREAFLVFSSLYMLVLAATAALLGELLSFHVILATKHMTTYDYIVAGACVVMMGSGPACFEVDSALGCLLQIR